jgi:AcrR family transcriptional regulator
MIRSTDTALLAAAERIYARAGRKGLTMRRLAKQVGLTPMAVYHHFQDKDALVDAIAVAGFARLEASMADARDPARGPVERLRLILHRYAEFAEAEPAVFGLMFSRRNPGGERFPEYFAEGRSPSFDLLRAAVIEGMRLGALRPADATESALTLWSQVHGLVVLRATEYLEGGTAFGGIVDRSIDRLLEGMAVGRTARSSRR